jgi:hypothetical protein
MTRSLVFFVFLAVVGCFGALTSSAQAQATRTWVSGLGDDANPCSRTAPCKTFPGAYSRTAAGGEIDAIDPGGYGNITIGHALTIDGGGGQVASILAASGTTGIVVNAGATDFVTIRNVRINGIVQSTTPGATGIKWNSGGTLNLENDVIQGFTGFCVDFEPVTRGFLHVESSFIQDCSSGGIVSAATSGINLVSVNNSAILNNGVFGVKSFTNSKVQVSNCMIAGTGATSGSGDGVLANSGGLVVESTTITGGGGNGVHATAGGIVWISNATVTNNVGMGLTFDGGGSVQSFVNNKIANNTGGTMNPVNAVPGQL